MHTTTGRPNEVYIANCRLVYHRSKQQAGLAQLGERQTEVHFNHTSEGHVFDPHKPHVSLFGLTFVFFFLQDF